MSSPKRCKLVISDDAKNDIGKIKRDSLKNWGKRGQQKYLATLRGTFLKLTVYPDIAPTHDELGDQTRLLSSGSHYIVYQIVGGNVHINRVLHMSRDIERNLELDQQKKRSLER